MQIISAYAAWTRRQGSVLNCGHVAVLAAAAVVLAVLAIAAGGAAALAVTAVLVFTACAGAVALLAWRLLRPALVSRPAPEPCLPRDLPAPAWPGPDWSPAAAQLPAAADNAAPSDQGTAQDLAAVLARAQVRP
jgi:hypothetical protein